MITIIVLLILAGVTLNLTLGEREYLKQQKMQQIDILKKNAQEVLGISFK